MEILKLLSTNEIIAQVISFLILLFLLRIFAWKKVLGLLDQRRAKIASEFKQIEDAKAEISKIKQELESNLAAIEEIKKQKIDEALARGKGIAEEIRKKANEDARAMIDKAKEDIAQELVDVKEELKEKIIELTIGAAETVMREKITVEQDKRLIKDFIEKMDQ